MLAPRTVLAATALALVVACSSPAPEAPAAPPSVPPPAPVAPAPSVPPTPTPTPSVAFAPPAEAPSDLADDEDPADEGDGEPLPPGPAGDAMRAYRAAIAAYNASDEAGYFGAFVDPLSCFHGETDRPLAELRRSRGYALEHDDFARLHVARLTSLRASDDEVVLVDRGAYAELWSEGRGAPPRGHLYMTNSSDTVDQGVHEKVVVMRRIDGTWRIAIETDRAHLDCITPPIVLDDMPADLAACREANRRCLRDADATCEECGACNGCNMAPTECLATLGGCVGAPEEFTTPW